MSFQIRWIDGALYLVLDDVDEVDNAVPRFGIGEIENVLLMTPVRGVVGLDLDGKSVNNPIIKLFNARRQKLSSLFHEGTRKSRLGVRVGVPCLFLDGQRRFG